MSAIYILYQGTGWTSLHPHPLYRERARQGIEIATLRLVGTAIEYAAGNTTRKPWVSEGRRITVKHRQ